MAPVQYYMYHVIQLGLWWFTLRQTSLIQRMKIRKRHVVWMLLLMVGVELLVAGFFFRWFLSIGLCFMALWPHWNSVSRSRHHENLKVLWTFLCLILTFFPILPPVGKHSFPLVV